MSKRNSDCGGSCEIGSVSDTAEIANLIVTRTFKEEDLLQERDSGVKDEADIFFRDTW